MNVRAKMKLVSITQEHWNPNIRRVKFSAEYDSATPEDQRFQKATPTAVFDMTIDNPAVMEEFTLGKTFYVDFSPVEPAAA